MVTTYPCRTCAPGDSAFYSWTKGECSAASAMTAGAVGLLQSWCHQVNRPPMDVDNVLGLLRATARPYTQDPTQQNPFCHGCSFDMYGTGVLDVGEAMYVLNQITSGAYMIRELTAYKGCPNVTYWDYFPVDSVVHGPDKYVQYRVDAVVDLGVITTALPPDSGRRYIPYVVWPRKKASLSAPAYGLYFEERYFLSWDQGIRDCRMFTFPDWGSSFKLTGYDYCREDTNHIKHFLFGENNVQLAYAYVTPLTSSVGHPADGAVAALQMEPLASPAAGPARIRFRLSSQSDVDVSVYGLGGRRIKEVYRGRLPAGRRELVWDVHDQSGARAPAGVYWVQIRSEGSKAVKRMVVLK